MAIAESVELLKGKVTEVELGVQKKPASEVQKAKATRLVC